MMTTLELLAPARNADVAIAAIDHGADAVYMGGPSHGARAAATNSVDDIARVCEYAHQFGARVYVTINTIIFDNEIPAVEKLVWQLYRIGVDALIVQDMAMLRMNLPPIALHASTQCDTRTAADALFLEKAGFSQIVIARECTLDEINQITHAVKVSVEAFVHGALCVSFSGDCYASYLSTARSANRGECAQMCRLPYDLVDANTGREIVRQKHLLSLRDMQRISHLAVMARAGVRSFKIEGRLKDADYVKNVVAAYSKALDDFIEANPGEFRRLSFGRVSTTFTPDTAKSFNRRFTPYFLTNHQPEKASLANFDTPKSIGNCVGTINRYDRSGAIVATLTETLNNGDGLGYFDRTGNFRGFRLNRVDGRRLHPASLLDPAPAPGTKLYRNSDVAWTRLLTGDTATRIVWVDMCLRVASDSLLVLDISDERGCSATVSLKLNDAPMSARSTQEHNQQNNMSRLGDTIYRLRVFETRISSLFIPNSLLAELRRKGIDALNRAWRASYRFEYRRAEDLSAQLPGDKQLTYHANVANSHARKFFVDHGATSIEPALETVSPRSLLSSGKPFKVMTTRYCLRREMGACLKKPDQRHLLPRNLKIRGKGVEFLLDFDCENCRMHVIKPPADS